MSATKVTAYFFFATLLVASFSAAISESRRPRAARASAPPAQSEQLGALTAHVQTQAGRLRDRLAAAPMPKKEGRNPFAFSAMPRVRPRPDARTVAAAAIEPVSVPAEPVFTLIGVAEDGTPAGLVRTALIADAGEQLHMLRAGQTLLGRYEVVTIGADAVELRDTVTGSTRRIGLR